MKKVKMGKNVERVVKKGVSFKDIPDRDKNETLNEIIELAGNLTKIIENQDDANALKQRVSELEDKLEASQQEVTNVLSMEDRALGELSDENAVLEKKLSEQSTKLEMQKQENRTLVRDVREYRELLDSERDKAEQLELELGVWNDTYDQLNGLGLFLSKQLEFDKCRNKKED